MKLVVFGASGQTGRLLVQQALDRGHEVTAYVRKEGSFTDENPNLRVVVGELDNFTQLLEAITGADVCLSTLGGGSLSKRSSELTGGIENIVTVMEQTGVGRFIYLSSIGAGESRYFMGPLIRLFIVGILLRIPLADHTANEKHIHSGKLNWTFVRPVGLSNGEKTGKYRHGSEFMKLTGNSQISRADVAAFMLDQVTSETYIKKGAWLLGN
jgi:putative NADH-flavin reductase